MFANTATILLAATSVLASSVTNQGHAYLRIKGQAFDINGLTPEGQDFFQLQSVLLGKEDKLKTEGFSHDDVIAGPDNGILFDGSGDPDFGVDPRESDDDDDDEESGKKSDSGNSDGEESSAYDLMCHEDMCGKGTYFVGEGQYCKGFRTDSICANCCVPDYMCDASLCQSIEDYIGENSEGDRYHCTQTYDPATFTSTSDCTNCCTLKEAACTADMCDRPIDYIGDGHMCKSNKMLPPPFPTPAIWPPVDLKCNNCCGNTQGAECESDMCGPTEDFTGEGKHCVYMDGHTKPDLIDPIWKQDCSVCCDDKVPVPTPKPIYYCYSAMCGEDEVFVGEGKLCLTYRSDGKTVFDPNIADNTLLPKPNVYPKCFNCCAHAVEVTPFPKPLVSDMYNPDPSGIYEFCKTKDLPCGAYGTCVSEEDGFTCECDDGWGGLYCETRIECLRRDLPCGDNGVCISGVNSFTCECNDGWFGDLCENPPPKK